MFIDSHIHLTHHLFENQFPCIDNASPALTVVQNTREGLIARMKESGIAACVEPGIDVDSNYRIIELSDKYPGFVFPAIGLHPTRTFDVAWSRRKELEKLSYDPGVVAIGELGLDYHYERKEQHRIKQMLWFMWQLHLADRRKLPLILHIRLADKDAIRILHLFKKRLHGGVCHCFCGDAETARIYTEEFGFMLGIGGALLNTYCPELEEAVKATPLTHLILETDSPYVKPQRPEDMPGKKWRKVRNTSMIIPAVARKIADIKGVDIPTVETITAENTKRLFHLNRFLVST